MINWLSRKKKKAASSVHCNPGHIQEDEIEMQLEDITIKLKRKLNLFVPHEITVVIPRVELRDRRYADGKLAAEQERIYNSVTLVHAPRHPQENPPDFGSNPLISPQPSPEKECVKK